MQMSAAELSARLAWFDSEIAQFSTMSGVSDRIQALHYLRAQVVAAQWLQHVISKQGGPP